MNQNTLNFPLLQAILQLKSKNLVSKSRYKLQIINSLLVLKNKHGVVFPAQSKLAEWSGVCRETINRFIPELIESEIILKKIDRHRNTCIYYLNPLLDHLAELSYMRKILPALKQVYFNSIYGLFKAIVTPYKEEEDYFNNPSITIVEEQAQKLSDFNRESYRGVINNNRRMKIPKKGRVLTMEVSKPTISPVLHRITTALNLTKAGQLKLLVFPEAALRATFDEYKRKSSLKEPFFWFLTYAKGYCIQNNLHVDWDMWYTLKRKYDIADDARYVLPKPAIKLPRIDYSDNEIRVDLSADYFNSEALKVEQAKKEGKVAAEYASFNYGKIIEEIPVTEQPNNVKENKEARVKNNFNYFLQFVPQEVKDKFGETNESICNTR